MYIRVTEYLFKTFALIYFQKMEILIQKKGVRKKERKERRKMEVGRRRKRRRSITMTKM